VDHPGFYTQLENRERKPIVDEKGREKGWRKFIGAKPTTAEYTFVDLYGRCGPNVFSLFSLLERLRALSRFSLEADASIRLATA